MPCYECGGRRIIPIPDQNTENGKKVLEKNKITRKVGGRRCSCCQDGILNMACFLKKLRSFIKKSILIFNKQHIEKKDKKFKMSNVKLVEVPKIPFLKTKTPKFKFVLYDAFGGVCYEGDSYEKGRDKARLDPYAIFMKAFNENGEFIAIVWAVPGSGILTTNINSLIPN